MGWDRLLHPRLSKTCWGGASAPPVIPRYAAERFCELIMAPNPVKRTRK
jgi:hypothetical protein